MHLNVGEIFTVVALVLFFFGGKIFSLFGGVKSTNSAGARNQGAGMTSAQMERVRRKLAERAAKSGADSGASGLSQALEAIFESAESGDGVPAAGFEALRAFAERAAAAGGASAVAAATAVVTGAAIKLAPEDVARALKAAKKARKKQHGEHREPAQPRYAFGDILPAFDPTPRMHAMHALPPHDPLSPSPPLAALSARRHAWH